MFIPHRLAKQWKMAPTKVYQILKETHIMDDYIIRCYDTLHTQREKSFVKDDVFKTVDMYFRGIWGKKTLKELRYSKSNDQICITNQRMLNKYLKFVVSYQVREDNGE